MVLFGFKFDCLIETVDLAFLKMAIGLVYTLILAIAQYSIMFFSKTFIFLYNFVLFL